jgi:hypothetical protein
MLSVAAAVCLTQEGLVASKRARRTKRRTWSKVDVRELKAHSRSKSPVKKIAKAMKRTVGALRQKALSLGLPQAIAGEPGLQVLALGDNYCAV